MRLLLNLFRVAPLCLAPFLASITVVLFALAGCTEDDYYEKAETEYLTVESHDLGGVFPLKSRALTAKFIVPGAFCVTQATVTEMDSSLNEVATIEGTVEKDSVKFVARNYTNPYALITIKGRWQGKDSSTAERELQTLTDISEVETPQVRLLGHLEVSRVKKLVKEGYPFYTAKRKSSHELRRVFIYLMNGDYKKPQLVETFAERNVALTLFALFTDGESMLLDTALVEKFRGDIADGVCDDLKLLATLGDNLAKYWLSLFHFYDWEKRWGENVIEEVAEYVESLLDDILDMEPCSRPGETIAVGNVESEFYGDSLVCDKRWYLFKRLRTEREKDFGTCAYEMSDQRMYLDVDSVRGVLDSNMVVLDSTYYICKKREATSSRSSESYFDTLKVFEDAWQKAERQEILKYYMGDCCISCENWRGIFKDSVYRCSAYYERWEYLNTDTLTHLLDSCGVDRLWTVDSLHGVKYACTLESWQADTPELDSLMQERPCDSLTDRYRTVKYDSNGYVCSNVKISGTMVYTFVRADSAMLAEYDFLALQEPCDPARDSLWFVEVTGSDAVYQCKQENDRFDFVKTDKETALNLKKAAFVNGQKPCDPETDRYRTTGFSAFGQNFYYVCRNNKYSEYVLTEVSYDEYYMVMIDYAMSLVNRSKILYACSDSVLALRGPAVEVVDGSITDPRDGKRYRVVTIGEQTWMAENLDYADSVATPNLAGNSWCYENEPDSCAKYGRLYTWTAAVNLDESYKSKNAYYDICTPVQGVCPDGWHVPTRAEWNKLFDYVENNNGGLGVGGGLKSKEYWSDYGERSGGSEDLFGFTALPAGVYDGRSFSYVTKQTYMHSVNQDEASRGGTTTGDWVYEVVFSFLYDHRMYSAEWSKSSGTSLRCLKDE